MTEYELSTEDSSRCQIIVADGAMKSLAQIVDPGQFDGVYVLHDSNLKSLMHESFENFPIRHSIGIGHGEQAKSMTNLSKLAQELLAQSASRSSLLIAFGGGVTTDLVAFLAAIYMRGVACILIPTSMLAMADAAVGGKNGVDLDDAKNILGTIRQPQKVVVDPRLLKTLNNEEYRQGICELIKKAAILDADAFAWLETNQAQLKVRDPEILNRAIKIAIELKTSVVAKDEKESGHRMLLNFGHTIGHAIEGLSNYSISHGDAVAMGMLAEMRVAKSQDLNRLQALLEAFSLPTQIPVDFDLTEIWQQMKKDKKTRNQAIRIAIPKAIGFGHIVEISEGQFQTCLAAPKPEQG